MRKKNMVVEVNDDEVVIAIMKPIQYKDACDKVVAEYCLKGVENDGWCYRIVGHTEKPKDCEMLRGQEVKGGVNTQPSTPRHAEPPNGQNPALRNRVNDCVCHESWDC